MKIELYVSVDDGLPESRELVYAMNYEDGWEELALFINGKFYICNGPIAGYELPFVQCWRYADRNKKTNMERRFINN